MTVHTLVSLTHTYAQARVKMGDIDETPAEVVPEPAATNGSQV